jgi:biotin carboxyl carrier protein
MIVWIEIGGRQRRVEVPGVSLRAGHSAFAVDGTVVEADARRLQDGVLSLLVEGRQYRCVLDGDAVIVNNRRFEFLVADPRSLAAQRGASAGAGGARSVKAPMPGRVVRVLVAVGDVVEEQQGLVAIEAMKMQNELKSPKAGKVSRVAVSVGETVAAGDVLVVVD